MYNILGQLKSEEKELENGNVIEIFDMYSTKYISTQSNTIRLLVDIAKHGLLLRKEIYDKNIKSDRVYYPTVINRKDVNTYLNAAYNTKSEYYVQLLIEVLFEMNIILGKEAQEALKQMVLYKFVNLPPRLSHFKTKRYYDEHGNIIV